MTSVSVLIWNIVCLATKDEGGIGSYRWMPSSWSSACWVR